MLVKGVDLWAVIILEIECKGSTFFLNEQILRTKKYGIFL